MGGKGSSDFDPNGKSDMKIMRLNWPREEVDERLKDIMENIHKMCQETADQYGTTGNYVIGANIAGFVKVVDAMIEPGSCLRGG